jgi:hypothetical protein
LKAAYYRVSAKIGVLGSMQFKQAEKIKALSITGGRGTRNKCLSRDFGITLGEMVEGVFRVGGGREQKGNA